MLLFLIVSSERKLSVSIEGECHSCCCLLEYHCELSFEKGSYINAWGIFLKLPESCYALTTDGWFSQQALEKLGGILRKILYVILTSHIMGSPLGTISHQSFATRCPPCC